MLTSLQHKWISITLSVAAHAALLAIMLVGMPFASERPYVPPASQVLAIQATLVDESAMRELADERAAEAQRIREAQEAQERARREAEAAAAAAETQRQQAELARREAEEAERAEQVRQQQLAVEREQAERQRVEAERLEREEAERQAREEEARLARERAAEAERQRAAEEQRQREAEEQRRREAELARQQAESEAELARMLAQEDERRRAEQSGERDRYIASIQSSIERAWNPPATAREGLECVVHVQQIPSGDVVSVSVGRCNGDDAVVRSIEAAVRRASPLPLAPTPVLYERNLELIFRPRF